MIEQLLCAPCLKRANTRTAATLIEGTALCVTCAREQPTRSSLDRTDVVPRRVRPSVAGENFPERSQPV